MKADHGRDGARVSTRARLRVLTVEDSEEDALLLLRELEKGGFQPEHERVDDPEGMRRALAEGEPWDVVLSDWRMPRFSATEALKMLRGTDSEAPFVIVSGKVGEEAAVAAMKAGAHDYVMKGNLTRLCPTVERGLREAEARRERRRAEEERDRLFEFSLDLLGVAGSDGYFKRVNPAFEETLGYTSGELLARPLIEFVHPEDRRATLGELENLGMGARTAYFENRYLRKDGTVVWLEWKAVPLIEEDLIYATARDVTERKRAEEALGRRDAILRAVAFAAERFLERVASWEESAPEVVERLGGAAGVSRVYIFENYLGEDGDVWLTQRYEWVAPGISPQIDNPLMQAFPYRDAGYGRWMEMLGRGTPVHGHTRDFPVGEQLELREQDILSIAIVPIFVEGEWWGGIGFDECFAEREWSVAEIEALKAAADTLGAAVQREQAEEAIRQSEQLYRTVVEQATEYISLVDVETRRIVGSNPAFREALGYSEEELGHMTLYDIVAHDRESVDENARRVVERGRYFLGERRHRRKDGTLVDVEVSASTVIHEGREVACIVGHDVTERRRAEEAVKESEERYRAVVEQAAEGIYLFDAATGDVLESNAAFGELLGYTTGELLNMRVYDFVAHDRESIDSNIRRILDEGGRFVGERRYRRKDGSLTDAAVTANRISYDGREVICAVVRDVTERKRAERALQESQRALATLMSNLPGMAYRCRNDPNWTMEFVSGGCLELTGYAPADLVGNRRRAYGDLIHPDDREEVWEGVQDALRNRSPFRLTYRITTASGAAKWVWEQGQGVYSPQEELLALEGFVTDATDRIRAFQMLEERVTALAGISAILTVGQPMEATLDALATRIVQSTAAVACAVVLHEEETSLFRAAGSHGLPEGYTASLEAAYRAGMRPPPVEVYRTRRPILVRDARQAALNTPHSSPMHGFFHEVPWDTIYFVPLVSRGRALGVLNLYYLPGQEPGEDEIVFLGAVADQTAVAVENAGLFAAAQGKAALEERQRLARELHDSVSQALYGIGLGSRTARALLDREGPQERVAEWLEYVLSLAEAGLTEMRSLIFELRPESLEVEGLVAALRQQAAVLGARHEIPVHVTLGNEPDLPLDTKETLYRIAQEALHNTVKHARASRADLKLECDERGIDLEVSDDGAGFDPEGDFSGHLGLKSMRERAARMDGTLQVESAPGRGTSIRVRIPQSK